MEGNTMYFTDDSLLPENQDSLIITAAPYGPVWLPEDYPEDIAVTWEEQVQKAVDCYNAGATILHIHVRDPKTGHTSSTSTAIRSAAYATQSQRWSCRLAARFRSHRRKTAPRLNGRLRHPPHADHDRP
jgi:hypothetical protein